ncbi:prephenate/arogenate dehydrogenase family protein (plasmid) [Azospirillum oryzae]|uniref:prephenate dehydrogenase n=1 Tax=Azospirillum oryzae TaxID=286727 RepID=A0A6N1AFA3_9PROT|nr:prephenate/arogenate dehydrogenase family protein [Azospirillum oryzae]KAA0588541.1 prephenate/arogenate dehydrogenase family protein [Azospirillum oryzae]QKS49889.1 prephenate/arogenate dehydrogenase family protein [Azospirillum oryzae]GLR81061.1 cyclohexadienyl dehydrogenase [Azospirillum oryzae]
MSTASTDTTSAPGPLFDRVAIIGIGLIGSSLARALAEYGIARQVVCADRSAEACAKALELGIVAEASTDPATALAGADLVILSTPVGSYAAVAEAIGPLLKRGTIVTDVGSVKQAALRDIGPHLPDGVHLIPGHPVAGTEHSGPEAGFATLFQGRWCILTPPTGSDRHALERVTELWRRVGSTVEIMEASHHDRVLAITSHLPHLIAYTIVGTASDLEEDTKSEVIKFSAGGFRDFTRIAASDPVMWRDVFLNNREAVLEILQRFTEDLTALQRAIRWGEGQQLQDHFTKTRAVRRGIIDAKQA